MAASSASIPSPVSAETSTGGRSGQRAARIASCARHRAQAGRPCSTPRGSAPSAASVSMPRSASTRLDVARAAPRSRHAQMSRTCRMRSASITSSSVARKAATSMVGRSEMKPTVSDRMMRRPLGSLHLAHGRIERGEHLVLGEHAGAGDAVEQRRLAGVGVADDGDDRIRHALAARAVQLARAHDDRRAPCGWRRCAPRSGAGRVSICASPGPPRKPKPPRWRSKMGPGAHEPALLIGRDAPARPAAGPRGCARAGRRSPGSGRCGRAPWQFQAFSRLRCWIGRHGMIDDDEPDLVLGDRAPSSSSTLPVPNSVAGRGRGERHDHGCSTTSRSIASARPDRLLAADPAASAAAPRRAAALPLAGAGARAAVATQRHEHERARRRAHAARPAPRRLPYVDAFVDRCRPRWLCLLAFGRIDP